MLTYGLLLLALTPEEVRIDRLSWTTAVDPEHTLIIHNDYGDIRLVPGAQDQTQFMAIAQMPPDAAKAEYSLSEDGGIVRVALQADSSLRIDLTVLFQPGTTMEAQTEAGRILAKNIDTEFSARSAGGLIAVETVAPITAISQTGSVELIMTNAQAPIEVTTRHGDIDVEIPPGEYSFSLKTAGEVTSDAAAVLEVLELDRNRRFGATSEGGTSIEIHSETGDIRILADPARHKVRLRPKR